jgi:molybdopterin/thiamine biosynthesis adenylyltransferase
MARPKASFMTHPRPHSELPELTDEERATYEWQMTVPDFGEEGQRRLKASSAFVSRVGGVGGTVACYLAAAGIGRLVLAHAGDLRPGDLNRQILMNHAALGTSRVACATRTLRAFNPRIQIDAFSENITEDNAAKFISTVDVVVDCAPMFNERLTLNRHAVRLGKPMVECAMYELQAQITTIIPGRSACLACMVREVPPAWKRQFPVFGAVSGMIGAMGAMEAIKLATGLGTPLENRMLVVDLRDGMFRQVTLSRNPQCPVCGG